MIGILWVEYWINSYFNVRKKNNSISIEWYKYAISDYEGYDRVSRVASFDSKC